LSLTQARIDYFVTDNPKNNTAINITLTGYFPNMPRKQRRGWQLRSLGHVIHLSAKAFLYGKDFDAFETNIGNISEYSELLREL
jgi:hypothetical protein